jgi:hypothetical protein
LKRCHPTQGRRLEDHNDDCPETGRGATGPFDLPYPFGLGFEKHGRLQSIRLVNCARRDCSAHRRAHNQTRWWTPADASTASLQPIRNFATSERNRQDYSSKPSCNQIRGFKMIYLKSFGVGLLSEFSGALIWTVIMFATGPRMSSAVSIDIRSLRSPSLWILVALLFLLGFLFEFRRASGSIGT